MGHVVKKTSEWDIDIDTMRGRIFLQMKWAYTWTKTATESNWTPSEKRTFHNTADKQIWKSWSNRVKLQVTGSSRFCQRFKNRDLPINLDAKWVTSGGHWQVTVKKVAPGDNTRDEVQMANHKIKLYTASLPAQEVCTNRAPKPGMDVFFNLIPESVVDANPALRTAIVDQTCRRGFMTMPHEFGHALGSSNDDEYTRASAHRSDTKSMLNIGTELRKRHFKDIVAVLNTMIPDCTFAVHSIRN